MSGMQLGNPASKEELDLIGRELKLSVHEFNRQIYSAFSGIESYNYKSHVASAYPQTAAVAADIAAVLSRADCCPSNPAAGCLHPRYSDLVRLAVVTLARDT
jgi:hypothetical protein